MYSCAVCVVVVVVVVVAAVVVVVPSRSMPRRYRLCSVFRPVLRREVGASDGASDASGS